ncbi:hypothetical protein CAI21_06290 [Alkalilimnicola ehrlichii]|uniref:amino acid adenylation domain-containing protein n=1 Tax=Alkalilimnicola ehrlichii TaxID=351052 RepID=UPI000E3708F8|nr:amino acid adenylation domain-containing protein [Alkalilimnicola ehrlichii]RFA30228.1 hypothetical protein CAI21_06290 [Alkalilimnicola ehrlichii]
MFQICRDAGILTRRAIRDNGQDFSYEDLLARSEEVAAFLSAAGVRQGDVVALMARRGFDAVAAVYGIMVLGAVYMPVDRAFPRDRVAYMLETASCRYLLTDDIACAQGLPESVARLPLNRAGGERLGYDPAVVAPDDLAYVLFTSGSTGRPKGVMIRHRSAARRMVWARERFGPDLALVLGSTSYAFDISILELFAPLGCGGALEIVDSALSLAEEHVGREVTLVNCAPSALSAVLSLTRLPPTVQTVILVGEVLHGRLARRLYDQGVRRVFNLYGPTEDTIYSTEYLVPRDVGDSVPIGMPLPGTEAVVMDTDLQPVADGALGELCLLGEGQAAGYINRPDLTDERFVTCTAPPYVGKRMYRTGDRAHRLPSGDLHCLGRLDDQVKIDGHRIELSEIAHVIMSVPDVAQATVIVAQFGAQRLGLAAYVVPTQGNSNEEDLLESIKGQVAAKLPVYMHPLSYDLLPSFPTTTSGKLDKNALPPPSAGRGSSATDMVDEALQAVLGRSDLPASAPIFLHGASSMDLVRIIAYLREASGRAVALAAAFRAASPDGLRQLLANAKESPSRLASIKPDPMAVTQAQRQMWLAQEMAEDPVAYLLFVEVETTLPPEALALAVREVVARHPSLHTAIALDEENLRRMAIDAAEDPVCTCEEDHGWEGAVDRHLSSAYPFTAAITKIPGGAAARIVADHAIFDRWSLNILRDELAAHLAGQALPPLPSLRVPVRDAEDDAAFIERLSVELAQAQLLAWAATDARAAHILREPLSDTAVAAIRRAAGALNLTAAAVGFGLFAECASMLTGVGDLSIGITLVDRHQGNINAIDCHVNTLPIYWSRAFGVTLEERLDAAGRRVFYHVAHSHVGIESVLSAVRTRRGEPGWVPYAIAYGWHSESPDTTAGSPIIVRFRPNPSARLPLTLWLEERGGHVDAVWTAHPACFETMRLKTWHRTFENIAGKLATLL